MITSSTQIEVTDSNKDTLRELVAALEKLSLSNSDLNSMIDLRGRLFITITADRDYEHSIKKRTQEEVKKDLLEKRSHG